MKKDFESTEPYKGVRDFYPEDMAVQDYIFETWSKTAESYGFQHYEASILEPSSLYKAKGAQNEEMVNEQTYTFIDRGEREVTLRPEMTPTVARMIAARSRELAFPARWYSIPNLFRYERPQRGRLREHWQLNCDIFGSDEFIADIEIIALAHQVMRNFGATEKMFQIRLNDRALMTRLYNALGITDPDTITAITRLNDRKNKIEPHTYRSELKAITGDGLLVEEIIMMLDKSDEQSDVIIGLQELGIKNVVFDKSLARGFDYYTGTVFELFEVDKDGNSTGRSIAGGGRYDNLTKLFSSEPISGIGFGMGDVTMRDFLVANNLLPQNLGNKIQVVLIPETNEYYFKAEIIANKLRRTGNYTAVVDYSSKTVQKRIEAAKKKGARSYLVVGEAETETVTELE